MKRILVLGGGAAGMVAAITAKETDPQADVVLVEGNPRIGKKLLATGNGRCNLSNDNVGPETYFTSNPGQLARMLEQLPDGRQWFADHGLQLRRDEVGRVYPYSLQASDVMNLLLYHIARLGVRVKTDCAVKTVTKKGSSYTVLLENGTKIFGSRVILALGGKAGPQFGTDGWGCEVAEALGLKTEPLSPCLVPLSCKKHQIAGLAGVRVRAEASLWEGDRSVAREMGEIQFTKEGISGIAVMQLSGQIPRLYDPVISLDLFPEMEENGLLELLQAHLRLFPQTLPEQFMTGLLSSRVGLAVWKSLSLPTDRAVEEWNLAPFAAGLKAWKFRGLSLMDYQSAQTTLGGVALSQIDPAHFSVRGMEGLYVVGELLDAAGMCGGFNLHWAFGSGIAAGRHAVAE